MKSSDLPRITQLVSDRSGTQAQIHPTTSSQLPLTLFQRPSRTQTPEGSPNVCQTPKSVGRWYPRPNWLSKDDKASWYPGKEKRGTIITYDPEPTWPMPASELCPETQSRMGGMGAFIPLLCPIHLLSSSPHLPPSHTHPTALHCYREKWVGS